MASWLEPVSEAVAAEAIAFNEKLEALLQMQPSIHTVEPAVLRAARKQGKGIFGAPVYVGGAADLLGEVRAEELDAYRSLFELVERRADMLDVLGRPSASQQPFVRLGHELAHPGLAEVALVGACYGLVHRALGAVSLIGPVRMDYEKALGAVRSAALELSHFVESIYDEA